MYPTKARTIMMSAPIDPPFSLAGKNV